MPCDPTDVVAHSRWLRMACTSDFDAPLVAWVGTAVLALGSGGPPSLVTGGPPAPGVWWWMILAPIFLGVLLFDPAGVRACGWSWIHLLGWRVHAGGSHLCVRSSMDAASIGGAAHSRNPLHPSLVDGMSHPSPGDRWWHPQSGAGRAPRRVPRSHALLFFLIGWLGGHGLACCPCVNGRGLHQPWGARTLDRLVQQGERAPRTREHPSPLRVGTSMLTQCTQGVETA